MYWQLFQSFMVATLLVGCGTLPPRPSFFLPSWSAARPSLRLVSTIYALGPQDLLDITVYDHPELNRQVRISPSGTFAYPHIGVVRAAGRTVIQLEREMTQRLTVQQPRRLHVAISVKEYRNEHVYILGAVQLPGVYALQEDATLEELLALAHGVTREAGGYVLMVSGYGNTEPSPRAKVRHLESLPGIRVNLNKLRSGNMRQSIHVHSGDMVYVPRQQLYFANNNINN